MRGFYRIKFKRFNAICRVLLALIGVVVAATVFTDLETDKMLEGISNWTIDE